MEKYRPNVISSPFPKFQERRGAVSEEISDPKIGFSVCVPLKQSGLQFRKSFLGPSVEYGYPVVAWSALVSLVHHLHIFLDLRPANGYLSIGVIYIGLARHTVLGTACEDDYSCQVVKLEVVITTCLVVSPSCMFLSTIQND